MAEDLHPSRWAGLEAGEGGERRTLLLLHGAFGRTHSSFGGMPAEAFARLHAAYGGRVIAFDHHTLTHDPAENARRLIALIPDGADLHLDVLAHSRGGLVARELAQNAAALPLGRRRVRIGRVMFAGTPNAGTPLADPARLRHLAGRLTTLLAATGQAGPLGAVQELVKHLASGASGDLPGLTAMSPAGAYLRGLNAFGPHAHGPRPRYRALAAEYGPPGDDGVFGEGVGNDVVVPVAAVGAMGRTGRVPDTHVLERVHHHAYFESAAATRRILTWAAEAS
ncbi:esterase/lipase family protein [Thermocatellispora tengchongensis]|uniref:esterase/lipase family protein n=1 Tax=Thermocatellispora tengchongensis TaxID=1073253 RepID=UPI003629D221